MELRSHSKRKISTIWSFFLYPIRRMIRSAGTPIGTGLMAFLRGRSETESTLIEQDLLFLLEDPDRIRIGWVKRRIFSFETNQKWKGFNWNMKT
uniref:Ribosomal protein S16 n=1 Tax=Corydalis trisecta TaxID=2682942 RepID=A0A8K1SNW0_9MAGN|nr:ribosomal protein S16 [Corydalis trisecta]